MLKRLLLCLMILGMTQFVLAQEEETEDEETTEKASSLRIEDTQIQAGVRAENLTIKGIPKKVVYREKVFDYFIEPYYQKNYFNVIPDVKFISGLNFYDKFKLSTELGFNYFLNDYMVYSREYSAINYEYTYLSWHPSFIQKNYLGSYLVKFETLNEDTDFNTAISVGRINPEYTPLTIKKRHNGIMWELSGEEIKLTLTGAQLQNFNNVKKYLVSSRLEFEQFGIGTLGVNFVNSWYDVKKDEQLKNNDYYNNRESGGAAIYLRFKDKTPWDREGANLKNVKIEIKLDNGNTNYFTLDNFSVGSSIEEKYIFDIYGQSELKNNVRTADFYGYFTYRIILPDNIKSIRFTSQIAGDYLIEYSFNNNDYLLLNNNELSVNTTLFQEAVGEVQIMPDITAQTYAYLEIGDDTIEDGYGAVLFKVEYYEDDQLKVSFEPSSEVNSTEAKYFDFDWFSIFKMEAGRPIRIADGAGYFRYKFPVQKGTKNVRFRMLLKNDFKVKTYLEGFENEANVLHSQGREMGGMNEGYYEVSLNSYKDVYENTYVSKSKKIIGFDYRVKVFDVDVYTEFETLIDERVYANKEIKNKYQNAWLIRAERMIPVVDVNVKAKYFRIDPQYNIPEFIDQNYDQNQYVDELKPFNIEKQYINYDPNLDVNNENKNFLESYHPLPVYLYPWNITESSYLGYDQQGYDVALEKDRLLNRLKTGLYYFKNDMISDKRTSDKIIYKLKYLDPVPSDSYIDNEYRLEYIKDNRLYSMNENNIRNFAKFIFSYWGIKNINWQFGINQIYVNYQIKNKTSDLTTEYLNSLKYRWEPIKDLTIEPMYMIKFYRFFRYVPDYEMFSLLTQHFTGGDINYKFLSSYSAYYIYRAIYTDDKLYPTENNFLHIMELGFTKTGKIFFRAGCNYTFQSFLEKANYFRDWNTARVFAEVKSYF